MIELYYGHLHIAFECSTCNRDVDASDAPFLFIQNLIVRTLSTGFGTVGPASHAAASTSLTYTLDDALSFFFAV